MYHKLSALKDKTDLLTLDVLMLSEKNQRPTARCIEHIAIYDYDERSRTTLKPHMVDMLRQTFAHQEETRQRNEGRAGDILCRIEKLEVSSWKNPHAIEDLGKK